MSDKNFDQLLKRFMVHPCLIDGQRTLVYERGLEQNNSAAYQALLHYAKQNEYQIREDKRADFLEGVKRVKDPARANIVTIMILTASIVSQSVAAGSPDIFLPANMDDGVEQLQIYPHVDLELSSFSTTEQMLEGLLGWINEHTSFEFKAEQLPKLEIVNQQQIAEIAFGKSLPSNIDASSLNILGLYNMNVGTVYLLDSVDLDTETGRGVLLHELVHYLQYEEQFDKQADCKNELEALAYMLEAKYLTDHDINPGFTQQHIDKLSECRS
ncbi:MAG: hypothetical protein HN764_05530 [Gammaproteobacteria bacterium]|nr:hypothetical protein [Gammaproteobacteria bacterium]